MPSRSDPFDDIERMFDRLSEQFANIDPVEFGSGLTGPAIDLRDEDDQLVAIVDLPGYEADDIDVTLPDERTLRIVAERERETEEREEGIYVRSERSHETVERSVRLPDPVTEDGTSATYENGVLTVTLQKQHPDDEGRSIPVE
ncbi:Hsp20/alpha crystallin family protein [Halapricum hydrolyticum]|uniref:Hsp20/alpha crystallin family protein n=1 Tax=Halapricum hydrolyticum TaxID=2979991 RepID=A0AAE3IDC1_9EURY|nr:Hsp20/alpha crystallin family protein [Halapricum hydrolyticum]MCU4718700.1 Hsp20/alpha crystallin family protein [Halapricum hydrolyticum]MCU4727614.1 Hsp20/alpha crystallin family protein [Halapricum hydrolyticum]